MLASGIEDLREKREAINREILRDEEEKAKIQKVCAGAQDSLRANVNWHWRSLPPVVRRSCPASRRG